MLAQTKKVPMSFELFGVGSACTASGACLSHLRVRRIWMNNTAWASVSAGHALTRIVLSIHGCRLRR